ncbi:MAG: FecR domain-containing protein [Myxococcales bacterium]|nr:FecR domain-containing protein [Myxococcales bacterium]
MTDETNRQASCTEIEEHMADLLDGSAADYLLEHVAECDRCRDARYDAEKHQTLVSGSGADYVAPADLEARVLAALDKQTGNTQPAGTPAPALETPDLAPKPASFTAPLAGAATGEEKAEPVPSTQAEPAPMTTTATLPSAPARASESAPAAANTEPGPIKTEASPAAAAPAKPESAAPPREAGRPEPLDRRPAVTSLKKSNGVRWLMLGGVGAALAAAAAAAIVIRAKGKGGTEVAAEAWHGNVAKLAGTGLSVCAPDGKSCATATDQGAVPAGSVLVTDAHTRARVALGDGTELSLDRGTRLSLGSEQGRRAKLESGTVVLDVAHIEGKTARIDLPKGHVEVLGTKFSLTAADDSASVNVSRGSVKLADAEGREVTVRAGEQGRSYAGMPPFVGASNSLGESIAWSEANIAEDDREEVAARGLGELKAKKPGDKTERDNAVQLTAHGVKVRIAGAMARTEVDETFTNNTDEVLEGIYRFPVPPDAKIERLALEVDGKLEEGAFVDRDRAAAIWRGAIVNAAPQLRQQVREEIVWVFGPWRDPALLEWQRGGRFELRVYPIPKRGSRRVILAYTQTIKPTGGVRRYSYPMAHDPSGSTKVGRFDVDVQVRGNDEAFGVRSQGYELTKSKANGADQLTMNASSFSPSGDLTVEYALPDRDAELTAWAYKPSGDEAAKLRAKAEVKPLPTAAGKTAGDANKDEAPPVAAKLGEDAPYVAVALRPKLPRTREDVQRSFAIVIDSSRSMFGENYKRAVNVATKFVRELDRQDSFTLLACDTDCRVMPGGMQIPSGQAALEARHFLEGIVPEGASDPTVAVRAARSAASSSSGKDLRVVYIGDGAPTSGAIRPAYVTRAIEDAMPAGSGTVTAIAIGADSDSDTLAAMARGGGGVMLPFVPGETTAEAVFAALGATYGSTLRDVTVELPSGLTEVAPRKVDTIVAGGEQLLVARMDKSNVEGTVVVRGKLGKEGFEQRYPIRIVASEAKGNAFVPRLFAATRITDLERETGAEAKKEAIRLSSAFDVASRFTSLLVLESEAMFKAFGLDNTRTLHQWTGEDAADATTAKGAVALAEDDADGLSDKEGSGPLSGSMRQKSMDFGADEAPAGGGFGMGSSGATASPAKPMAKSPMPSSAPPAIAAEPNPFAEEKAKKDTTRADPRSMRRPPSPPWNRGRRMIPMRRIWERKGSVLEGRVTAKAATPSAIGLAERDVQANTNHRGALRKLFTLYAIAGDMEQARSLSERWSEKEPLDPEALTARADVAARAGDRENAIRILGSVVDVRPDDIASQKRLARLHRWAGRPAVGCRHSLALAQLRSSDASLLAEAASCGRRTGEARLTDEMLGAAEDRIRKAAEALISKFDNQKDDLLGDLRLEASWPGGDSDVDIALIDPDGNRISWLGAPTKALITASDVASSQREGLALRGAKPGEYVIEVVRGSGSAPVRGEIIVTVAGAKRTVPFFLTGTRETVGIAKIAMESRLVPANTGWGGGWE